MGSVLMSSSSDQTAERVVGVAEQAEQAAGLGVHDRVGGEESSSAAPGELAARGGHAELAGGPATVGELRAAG